MPIHWSHIIAAITYLIALSADANARQEERDFDVDIKNGNLNFSVVDFTIPGAGYDISIRRSYNSRTRTRGIFGNGWCSTFETKLIKDPSGDFFRVECGAGVTLPYSIKARHSERIVKIVDQLIAADVDLTRSRSELLRSISLRAEQSKRLGIASAPDQTATYFERGRGPGRLTLTTTGYVISNADQTSEVYDQEGRLLKLLDNNNNYLLMSYRDGRVVQVEISKEKSAKFAYNSAGFVSTITPSTGKSVSYEYDPKGNLLAAKSGDTSLFYSYEADGRLKEMRSGSGKAQRIELDAVQRWVRSVTADKNCSQTFVYPKAPSNMYEILVKYSGCMDNAQLSYQFMFETVDNGTNRILRMSTVKKPGETVQVDYHPVFQTAIRIIKNGEVEERAYDATGLLTSIGGSEPTAAKKLDYDVSCRKLSRLRWESGEVQFEYDPIRCNLVSMTDSDGETMKIHYDDKGRISILEGRKNIYIQYDDTIGKPILVSVADLGELVVTYKPDGEIKSVTSSQGSSVATQVASEFNKLMSLAKTIDGRNETPESLLGMNCSCSPDVDLFTMRQ
jgi:YD repeat-containing protein